MAKYAEKLKSSCITGGNVRWCSHCGKQFGGSSKGPSNSIPKYKPRRIENMCPHKSFYMNAHSNWRVAEFATPKYVSLA